MIYTKIKELLEIVEQLKTKYPKKEFTLDGRLIGDLGEIIVAENYKIDLYDKVKNKYDGITENGKIPVQIKTTMKNSVWYPRDYHPELFLAIQLHKDGTFTELYNGNAKPFEDYIKTRKRNQDYNYFTVTKGKLLELNELVDKTTRIERRK